MEDPRVKKMEHLINKIKKEEIQKKAKEKKAEKK